MLVLSRRPGEKVVMGLNHEIEVVVLEVRGDKVRLGITAPNHIPCHREEVLARVETERILSPDIGGESGGA